MHVKFPLFFNLCMMTVSYHEKMFRGTVCTSLFSTACVLFDKTWSYNALAETQPFGFWSAVSGSWFMLATG